MKKINPYNIMKIISEINFIFFNNYDMDPITYYSNGHCYYYAKILQSIFKEGKLYYGNGHVVIKIDNFYYDVQGIVPIPKRDKYIEIEDESHEEYVKMILAPLEQQTDLEIMKNITNQIKDNEDIKTMIIQKKYNKF